MLRSLRVLLAICNAGSTTLGYRSESPTLFELFSSREEISIWTSIRKKRRTKEYKKEERKNMRTEERNTRMNGII